MQTSPKVHLAIGHERSLCGLNPNRGTYDITRNQTTFFQSPISDQCERCLRHFKQRGYSIKRARDSASQQPRIPRSASMADRVAAC